MIIIYLLVGISTMVVIPSVAAVLLVIGWAGTMQVLARGLHDDDQE